MEDTKQNHSSKKVVKISAQKFHDLIQKTLKDVAFRLSLESDPKKALASVGIDISDPATLGYLKQHMHASDDALRADGDGKKIFAVSTCASIVVAVSTPAFPKGEGRE